MESDTRPRLDKLPTELLLSILNFLGLDDIFRCRYTCRNWYGVFTSHAILSDAIVHHFPHVRDELDMLSLGRASDAESCKWRFDNVYARHYALRKGYVYSEKRCKLYGTKPPFHRKGLPSGQDPVSRWKRELFVPSKLENLPENNRGGKRRHRVPSDLAEPFWSADDGLLVYLNSGLGAYVLLDLQSDALATVPFDLQDRVVRRLRLRHGVLIFEWAQKAPYHMLNPTEEVHRHFVTAYDVVRTASHDKLQPPFAAKFRNEWKLHFLGFPMVSQDVWISAHTSNHYAVYIWQPNRSAWGEDEPIECLYIWDISEPSKYRPSECPSSLSQPSCGPRLVKVLPYKDLDHLKIRQRDSPTIRGLGLDDASIYVAEAQYGDESGLHNGRHPLDCELGQNWIRVTGIPILGAGPPEVKTHGGVWEDCQERGGRSMLHWAQVYGLDPMTFNLTAPGQAIEDRTTGLRFIVQKTDESRVTVAISHAEWGSCWTLDDCGTWNSGVKIHADEQRLIMEMDEGIRILHFDRHVAGHHVRKLARPKLRHSLLGDWTSK